MRKYLLYLFGIIGLFWFTACDTDDPASPATQEIVYSDTSLLTGELSVEVLYFRDNTNSFNPAPSGTQIFLYATYEDLINHLPIYALETHNDNSVYFGYINYGNYYVLGTTYIGADYYEGVSVVQVRPRRQEWLTLTLYEIGTN